MTADTQSAPPRLLIVAIGNRLAGDDAAAPEIAAWLAARNRWPNCTIRESPDALALACEDLSAFDMLLVIDAVESGSLPGTVHFFPLSLAELRARETASVSTHGAGLVEVMALAEALKTPLPPMFLLGIEGHNFQLGSDMCAEVRRAAQLIVANFDQYYRAICFQPSGLSDQP